MPDDLAAVDDVKRVLGLTADDETRDSEIIPALAVASEVIRRELGGSFSSGATTETFWRIPAGARLRLRSQIVSVTSVVADGVTLGFTQDGPDSLRLDDWDWGWPFFSAPVMHKKILVSYVGTYAPDPLVIEATANIAADITAPIPGKSASGLSDVGVRSASIGGFSYNLSESAEKGSHYAQEARRYLGLLRPQVKATVV